MHLVASPMQTSYNVWLFSEIVTKSRDCYPGLLAERAALEAKIARARSDERGAAIER